jgi:hypothetical protein
LRFPENAIGGLALGTFLKSLKGQDCTWHALTETNAPLAAHFDFEDAFACRFIGNDGDISKFEASSFIGPKPRIGHKQNVIV